MLVCPSFRTCACTLTRATGHAQGADVGLADLLAIATGVIGIAAGKMLNKGLLVAYMVCGILTALVFALAVPAFTLLAASCGMGKSMLDDLCQNGAGEASCCHACNDLTTCGGAACMWVPAYTDSYCRASAGEAVPSPCDKVCCEALTAGNPNIQWVSEPQGAGCNHGIDGYVVSSLNGQGTCETDADVTSKSQCTLTSFDTYTNRATTEPSPNTYANTGCPVDDMDTGLCEYTTFVWITIFVTLGVSIAGSVMGCCVVCCKNDQLGGGDDSG